MTGSYAVKSWLEAIASHEMSAQFTEELLDRFGWDKAFFYFYALQETPYCQGCFQNQNIIIWHYSAAKTHVWENPFVILLFIDAIHFIAYG